MRKSKMRPYNVLTKNVPNIPYSYNSYFGEIEVTYSSRSKLKVDQKLSALERIQAIGKYTKNGMGLILWKEYSIKAIDKLNQAGTEKKSTFKLKMSKRLPRNLPRKLKQLIKYGLLHDFYHCVNNKGVRYPSKIYVEPDIRNTNLIRLIKESHRSSTNSLVVTFKKYDQLASYITRNKKSPRKSRYNWIASKMEKSIDFTKLANDIAEIVNTKSVYQLYEYVYNSKELQYLNESLEYGHTSLRTHLLLITNLILRDYKQGNLDEDLKG
jgi:hypothetical protein